MTSLDMRSARKHTGEVSGEISSYLRDPRVNIWWALTICTLRQMQIYTEYNSSNFTYTYLRSLTRIFQSKYLRTLATYEVLPSLIYLHFYAYVYILFFYSHFPSSSSNFNYLKSPSRICLPSISTSSGLIIYVHLHILTFVSVRLPSLTS